MFINMALLDDKDLAFIWNMYNKNCSFSKYSSCVIPIYIFFPDTCSWVCSETVKVSLSISACAAVMKAET